MVDLFINPEHPVGHVVILWCAGQESNLLSPKAAVLQTVVLSDWADAW